MDEEEEEIIIRYKFNQKNIRFFGQYFVNNNKNNCKIKINDKKMELIESYNNESFQENEIIEIKLIGISKVTNMCKMFYDCS